MSTFNKYLASISSTIGLLAIGNLVSIDAAQAFNTNFTNGGFESGFSSWTTTGDASIQGNFQTIAPPGGSNHALITTACPGTANASGECYDTHNTTLPRVDDSPTAAGTFNKSGNDQISASVETPALQNFLGLSANSLSLPRENGQITGTRTPKEGSAYKQTFTVDENAIVDFSWNYLTNDGKNNFFGDSDFGFVTLYRNDSLPSDRTIEKLDDSTGSVPSLSNTSTNFQTVGGYKAFSRTITPGQYVLGYGVVDADGTDRSSGLLVDKIMIRPVPFDFSPSLGLSICASIFGFSRLRKKFKWEIGERSKD